MPRFDIVKKTPYADTPSFRVAAVMSNFTLDPSHLQEEFKGDIAIEGEDWSIGLIVGGSGTGKSTIAREIFPDAYIERYEYGDRPIVDEMPQGRSIKDIELAFTSVGFASPPSWIKPYSVLSNGEKMRADLARALLEDRDLIVFDEFTSVVNREVAKTAAMAISKAVRRTDKRFVAVSCHRDIIDWLAPDWIYDTDEKRYFFVGGGTPAQTSSSRFTSLAIKMEKGFGKYLGGIII